MKIAGTTKVAAVIGWPVEHSLSPTLMNAAFAASQIDAVYVAFAVAPAGLDAAIDGFRALGVLGASVTVPHKQSVMALCDEVEPLAARIGAVNCLAFSGERVVGHNTDTAGFMDSLESDGQYSVAGKTAVVLGGGGAARAVHTGLVEAGAAEVRVIARTPGAVTFAAAEPWTARALRDSLKGAELLVDCTSTGLSEQAEAAIPEALPLDALAPTAVVCSLVYHREPALLAAAKARGLRTLDGMGMLVHQGARAFSLWTGKPAPISVMWDAVQGRKAP